MIAVLALIFRRRGYDLFGGTAFTASTLFYLWSSQVIVIGLHGITFLFEVPFVAAALLMATLLGVTLPVQVYAFRVAATAAAGAGGTLLSVVVGTAAMSCCAPVLLPALLSLLGFSGTTILGINGLSHHYWLPLAVLSILLLAYSLVATTGSLRETCQLVGPTDIALEWERSEDEQRSTIA